MTFVRRAVENAAVGVGVADNPAALEAFLKPGTAAMIWRRQTPPAVQHWLDGLDGANLPTARVVLRPCDVLDMVQNLFDLSGMANGPERKWLETDITILSEMFSDLMRAEYLRLRLDVVTSDACRKFHIDAITARLVCTYRGTGTQYGISTDGNTPSRIFTVQTGTPILLRGTLWPDQPPSGVLHRSPPIEGTGQTRLVLVLDPVCDPEDEV